MPAMMEEEDPEDLDNVNQEKSTKPPRNGPPPVRHSISEALLVDTSNLVSRSNVHCLLGPFCNLYAYFLFLRVYGIAH